MQERPEDHVRVHVCPGADNLVVVISHLPRHDITHQRPHHCGSVDEDDHDFNNGPIRGGLYVGRRVEECNHDADKLPQVRTHSTRHQSIRKLAHTEKSRCCNARTRLVAVSRDSISLTRVANWATRVKVLKLLRPGVQKGWHMRFSRMKQNVIIAAAASCPGFPGITKTSRLVMSSLRNISTPSHHQN